MDNLVNRRLMVDSLFKHIPIKGKLELRRINKQFKAQVEMWFRRFFNHMDPYELKERYGLTPEQIIILANLAESFHSIVIDESIEDEIFEVIRQPLMSAHEVKFQRKNIAFDYLMHFFNLDYKSVAWKTVTVDYDFGDIGKTRELIKGLTAAPDLESINISEVSRVNRERFLSSIETENAAVFRKRIKSIGTCKVDNPAHLERLFRSCINLEAIDLYITELCSGKEDFVASVIQQCPIQNMKHLFLESQFSNELFKSIAERWTNIESLTMSNDTPVIYNLVVFLDKFPKLKRLALPTVEFNSRLIIDDSHNPDIGMHSYPLERLDAEWLDLKAADLKWLSKNCPHLNEINVKSITMGDQIQACDVASTPPIVSSVIGGDVFDQSPTKIVLQDIRMPCLIWLLVMFPGLKKLEIREFEAKGRSDQDCTNLGDLRRIGESRLKSLSLTVPDRYLDQVARIIPPSLKHLTLKITGDKRQVKLVNTALSLIFQTCLKLESIRITNYMSGHPLLAVPLSVLNLKRLSFLELNGFWREERLEFCLTQVCPYLHQRNLSIKSTSDWLPKKVFLTE